MSTQTKNNDFMVYVNIAITCLLMFGFRFLPPFTSITPYGMAVLGIFIGLLYGWTVSKNGLVWVSTLGFIAAGTTDYGICSKVLANVFANDTIGLLFFSMIMIGPIMQSDVGEYLMVRLLDSKLFKGKPWMFTILVCFGAGLVAKVSSSIVLVLLIISLCTPIFKAAGYKRGDKYPTLLMIGMFMTVLLSTAMFPFKGWGLYTVGAVSKAAGGIDISYGGYLIVSIIHYVVFCLGFVLLMRLLRCDVSGMKNIDIEALKEKHKNGLSKKQKCVLGIVLYWVVASIVVSLFSGEGIGLFFKKIGAHGIALSATVLFMTIKTDGEFIATPKSVAAYVQWDTVLVMAGGLFIGGLMTAEGTGIVNLVSQILAPILYGKSEFVFLLLLTIISLLATNFFNNMAVMILFANILGSMYAAGLITNIYGATMILSLTTILGFWTPASSGFGAMLHGIDFLDSKKTYLWGGVAMIYCIITFVAVVIPLSTIVF